MSFRRMIPFLLLNVLVSATVVLGILWWWDGRSPQTFIDSPGIQDESALAELLPSLSGEAQQPTEPPSDAEVVEEDVAEETAVQTAGDPSGERVHVVRAGDTVGRISNQYGVAIEAIMEANGMDNPNFLSVGQELIIPNLSGIPTPIPTVNEETDESPSADTPPTPIPTVAAGEGEAFIEITAVRNVGNVDKEVIEIVNSGSSEVSLAGWQVRDQSGNSYTFGYITLFGEGAGILLFSGSGLDGPTNFNWGQDEAVWQPGETIQLVDTDENVIAELIVP